MLLTKKIRAQTFRKEKNWGYELWIENLSDYCGKILHIDSGKKCSFHFHMNKLETMFLSYGRVKLNFVDPENAQEYSVDLFPGDSILIPRGQVHQIQALEESEIFEFSTIHEESDSYRVKKGD